MRICFLIALFAFLNLCLDRTAYAAEPEPKRIADLTGSGGVVLKFSKDGKRLLTGGRESVQLWSLTDYKPIGPSVSFTERIEAGDFHDARKLFVVAAGKQVVLFDGGTSKKLQTWFHPDRVLDVSFHPDGKWAVTACLDGVARVWELESGKILHQLKHGDRVRTVCFSPDGSQILVGTILNFEEVKALGYLERAVEDPEVPGNVYVWEPPFVKYRWRFRGVQGNSRNLRVCLGRPAFSPNGKWVAVPTGNGVFLCDARSGIDVANTFINGPTVVVDFSGNSERLLTAGMDGSTSPDAAARILDIRKDPRAGKWSLDRIQGLVPNCSLQAAALSPDGQFAAIADYGDFLAIEHSGVWEVTSGKRIVSFRPTRQILGQTGRAPERLVRFSPDGSLLAVGCLSERKDQNSRTTIWQLRKTETKRGSR